MNLKDFIRDRTLHPGEAGQLRIVLDNKVPNNMIVLVGDGTSSAKISMPPMSGVLAWNAYDVGEMLVETMEFFERKQRSRIIAIAVSEQNQHNLEQALRVFAAEDPDAEVEKEWTEEDDAT